MRKVVVTLAAAAAVGAIAGAASMLDVSTVSAAASKLQITTLKPSYSDSLAGCSVTDGDTIRCGDERIRLLGIDAPEMPGHCREGRVCVSGDPYASTASLVEAMTGELRISRVGEDRYGRTLAIVSGAKGDLSCWQLAHGQAAYIAKWDNGLRVARLCPSAI